MHRRPTLTQRHGVVATTRYVLYGNRVRVIRQSPLLRDDRYIPLSAVDPDGRTVRRPEPRLLMLALVLALPGVLAAVGWPQSMSAGPATAALGLSLLSLATIGPKGWPGRTYVHHGELTLLADVPDASTFRAWEARLVAASREEFAAADAEPEPEAGRSVAHEIRRLHGHCHSGALRPEAFARHKLRLIRGLQEHGP
jgi:hypothetical protein